jgi:hypothetical protein
MPDNRNALAACRAAVSKSIEPTCSVGLVDGTVFDFRVTEVLEDALLGSRVASPNKACLIRMAAITTIEFG